MTTAYEAAQLAAARIEAAESSGLNATIAFDPEVLLRQGREVDARTTPSRLGVGGLPLAVKDNICTVEYDTTCGSRILENYRSPYEATAVSRLKAAGGMVACKSNLDEFAMGSSSEHSAFGRVRHPVDAERVPGGSSGGSAALVAAGAVDAALGSDTGGSVRQPAAFCGVVGLKPTYGRVSRYGLIAFGSSLDQIGVIAASVQQAAAVLEVISGRDERDSTCADVDPIDIPLDRQDLDGIVVGLPAEYFPSDLDPVTRKACDRAVDAMRRAGAVTRDVSLPHARLAVPCYYVIAPAEASANLARYDGVRYGARVTGQEGGEGVDDLAAMYRATRGAGFGVEVRRRIVVGTHVLSSGYYEAYYTKAQIARGRITRDFTAVFDGGVDVLFTPTTPTTAFKAGELLGDPVAMYLGDVFVCAANLAGIPAISVPIGRANGLPIGGQLMAPVFAEQTLLNVAQVMERVVDGDHELR